MGKYKSLFFFLFLIYMYGQKVAYSQNTQVDQISFGSRNKVPILVEVFRDRDRVRFEARNSSHFPYEVILKFSTLENLQPRLYELKKTAFPGTTIIQTFTMIDPALEGYGFDYSYSYRIGNSGIKADYNFPYLVPISNGKLVNPGNLPDSTGRTVFIDSYFLSQYDTIYAMRKGTVTSVPGTETVNDKISIRPSIEILHQDGTVSVINGFLELTPLVKESDKVYPGQPLGFVLTGCVMFAGIYEITGDGRLKSIPVMYSNGKQDKLQFRQIIDTRVSWPEAVIIAELTKAEVKKWEKGQLYGK